MNLHELVSELIINTKGSGSSNFFEWSADSSLVCFLPELTLCATIVLMLLVRVFDWGRRADAFFFALIGSAVALCFAAPWSHLVQGVNPADPAAVSRMEIFTGMLVYDSFTVYARTVLLGFAILFAIFTKLSGIPDQEDGPDIYTLVLGATLGMCLMASANHLIMIFMAVEMASVPSYALAGMLKGRRTASEAALKYSIYGAGAAGVMLYGISLLAGVLNTAHLPTMAMELATRIDAGMASGEVIALVLGGLMLTVGLAFKLSAVPFHFWAPDVFEGAAAEVGAFLSIASKAAALALLVRVALGLGSLPPAGYEPGERTLAMAAATATDTDEEKPAVDSAEKPEPAKPAEEEAASLTTAGPFAVALLQDEPPAVEDEPAEGKPAAEDKPAAEPKPPVEDAAPALPAEEEEPKAPGEDAEPTPPVDAPSSSGKSAPATDEQPGGEAGTPSAEAEATDSDGEKTPLTTTAAIAALAPVRDFIAKLIALLAIVTCTFGNLAAYGQTNIKRLMAYSTIAHAGYMMMAVPALLAMAGVDNAAASGAVSALCIYLAIYLFMNLGAFAVIAFLRNEMGSEEISDYAGLIKRCPVLVVMFSLLLFSLVGLPPLAGFIGKFAIFAALVDGYRVTAAVGQPATYLMILLVAGGVNTAISLFYYLRVVRTMTMLPEPEGRRPVNFSSASLQGVFVGVMSLAMIILFLFWDGLSTMAEAAAQNLLG